MRYDLIIVGGGLVGAGLAVALRHANVRIALIDARLPANDDPRLFALNHSSCQFLANLGVWPALASHAAPIHAVHVSHQGKFGAVNLNREDLQLSDLGHVIPAKLIEAELNAALQTLSNVTLFRPAKLKQLSQQNNVATLVIDTESGEKTLSAPLVVGADGTDSTVRTQLNIPADVYDYAQNALVTRTTLQRSHHHIAYERFHANGAIAMLPLAENECATIWSADHDKIQYLQSLSDAEFLQVLQKEFGYRLGRLLAVSQRHVFPLRMVKAQKAVEQCVYLLGNSAHTLHPVAAQGFNLAVYEVAALVEGLMQKTSRHEIFSQDDLMKIHEETQKQQHASIFISHRLTQLFSHESTIKSMAVQLGMIALDIANPVKRKFIQMMLGRTKHSPRLLLSVNE